MSKALKLFKQDDLTRYKILKHISSRSRCDFFKVVEKETDKLYTFKILRPVNENDQEDDLYSNNIKKFTEEAEIWSIINSPLVVEMIGLCFNYKIKNNFTTIMVLEYCLNSSLEKLINRIKSGQNIYEWNDTRKLICIYGIAAGMQYLHSKQIIHLDLRPANILLNESLYPKINDFYTSIRIGKNIESSLKKNALTIDYMAPEVVNDDFYSTAADVYSFGVTVHEILICEKPFEGNEIKISDQIPTSYKNLISKCLVTDPSYRPTFSDIVKYLRNNEKFISESVDEEEFIQFCDFVDSAHQVTIEFEKKVEINSKPIDFKNEKSIKKESFADVVEQKIGNDIATKVNIADQFEKVHKLDKNNERLKVNLPISETNQQKQEEQKEITENIEEKDKVSLCEEESENEEDQKQEEPKQKVMPENEEKFVSFSEEKDFENEEYQSENSENNKDEVIVKTECSEEADESEQRSESEDSSNSGVDKRNEDEKNEPNQRQKSKKKSKKLKRRRVRRVKNRYVIRIKEEPDQHEIPDKKETIEKEVAKPIQTNESVQQPKEPSSPPKNIKNSPPLKPFVFHYDRSVFYEQNSSPSLQAKHVNGNSPGPIKLKVTLKDIGLEGLDSPDPTKALELQRKRKIEQENSKLNERNKQNTQANLPSSRRDRLAPMEEYNKNNPNARNTHINPKPISLLSSAHNAQRSQKIIPKTSSRRNKY